MPKYRSRQSPISTMLALATVLFPLYASPQEPLEGRFEKTGDLQTAKLDEASGMVAGEHGVFYMHNDDGGAWLYAMGFDGNYLGRFRLPEAKAKDWEDITRVPGPDGPLLVVADSGDNQASRKDIELYILAEPTEGDWRGDKAYLHKLKVRYEDGPRDVEAVTYDPIGKQLLFLSKRDQPPRLYGVPLSEALNEKKATAKFLAEVANFRPPTRLDLLKSPMRGGWVSQPTGMDISPDGTRAAVITYRSLYVFTRAGNESWAEALQGTPVEYVGPPGFHDEAVAFDLEGDFIYVTTEKIPAPIHRLPVD